MYWNINKDIEKLLNEFDFMLDKFKEEHDERDYGSLLFFLSISTGSRFEKMTGPKKQENLNEREDFLKTIIPLFTMDRLKEYRKTYKRNLESAEHAASKSAMLLEIVELELEKRRRSSDKIYGIARRRKHESEKDRKDLPHMIGLRLRAESEEGALEYFYEINGPGSYPEDTEFYAVQLHDESENENANNSESN